MDVQIKRTKKCPQCVNAFRLQLCPASEWDDSPLYVYYGVLGEGCIQL